MNALRRRSVRIAIAAVVTALATTAWMPAVVLHPDNRVLREASDASSTARDYWSITERGTNPFASRHDPLLGAPEGSAYTPQIAVANALQPLFVWTVKSATGILGAINLFMLLGLVLTGTVTYALLDRLAVHPLAAAFGAYAFTFNTYLLRKIVYGHGSLVHAWIFPALVLAWLELRRRRTPGSAIVVGGVLATAFYLHSYYGAIASVLAAVLAAFELTQNRGRQTVVRLATAAGVAAVLTLPAVAGLVLNRGDIAVSTGHRAEATEAFGARPLAYLVPAAGNPITGGVISDDRRATLGPDGGEPDLYFGWVTILLAGAGVVLLVRRRAPLADGERRAAAIVAAVLVPVGFLWSLPNHVDVLGVELPTPSVLAGFFTNYLRVYGRFGVLVGLGLAMLAAFALDALVRRRRGPLLGAAALVLLVADLAYGAPIPTWNVSRTPAHDTFLASRPRGIVAFYPPQAENAAGNLYVREELFWQTRHGQPLFFTESSRKDRGWAIRELVDRLDEPNVPQLLAAEGVRYVVVNDAVYRAKGEVPPGVPQPLLARFGDTRVFEIVAEPGDLEAALHDKAGRVAAAMGIPVPTTRIPGDGFQKPERFDGQDWRWLSQDGVVEVDVDEPNVEFELGGRAFSANRERRLALLDQDGRALGEAQVGVTKQDLRIGPFRLPKGRSRLRLVVTPPPEQLGASDPRYGSIFLSPIEIRPLADFSRG
jgi:hypothetical protein